MRCSFVYWLLSLAIFILLAGNCNGGSDDDECIICTEKFSDTDDSPDALHGRVVGCKHHFHRSCLREWLTSAPNKSCPYCRQPADTMELEGRGNGEVVVVAGDSPPAVVPNDQDQRWPTPAPGREHEWESLRQEIASNVAYRRLIEFYRRMAATELRIAQLPTTPRTDRREREALAQHFNQQVVTMERTADMYEETARQREALYRERDAMQLALLGNQRNTQRPATGTSGFNRQRETDTSGSAFYRQSARQYREMAARETRPELARHLEGQANHMDEMANQMEALATQREAPTHQREASAASRQRRTSTARGRPGQNAQNGSGNTAPPRGNSRRRSERQ